MGIIIDLVIILFVLVSIILGYKKGLVALGIHLFAFIIAIVITFILYRPIGNLVINTTKIDENLQETIQSNVENFMNSENSEQTSNSLIESAKNGMLPEVSRNLAINIIYGITMLVLFLLVRICLVFITAIANMITKLPILNQVNKVGGMVYGLVRGIFVVYAILLIVNLIIVLNPTSGIKEKMDETYLAKTMSEYNILNIFFESFE